MAANLRVGFCVSGRGRLFQAAVQQRETLGIEPVLLVLDNSASGELDGLAEREAIPRVRLTTKNRTERDRILLESCADADLDLLCLTFNKLIPVSLAARYWQRIINVHMSLLPAFKGFGALEAAIAAGVRFAGATIHEVTEDVDGGPVVGQCVVGVGPQDTAERLGARIYAQLRPLYLQVIRWYAEGRVGHDADGRVVVDGAQYGQRASSPSVEYPLCDVAAGQQREAA